VRHRADVGEIELLEEELKNHEQYTPTYYDRKNLVLDAEVHLQIASMAKNKVLENLLRINFEHTYFRFALDAVDPNRMPLAV
jgi:DNA-binding GntR family transcriptional regulator